MKKKTFELTMLMPSLGGEKTIAYCINEANRFLKVLERNVGE